MTDTDYTPTDDEEMLVYKGKTLKSEAEIGRAASKLLRAFDHTHAKSLEQLHPMILDFGRMLRGGRNLYERDDLGFGEWIKRYHLDTGKLGKDQKERNACMQIAELHDVGVTVAGEDGMAIPRKLDLIGCVYTTPTDIMKWVRKTQRFLLPHLSQPGAVKLAKTKGKKKGRKGKTEFEPNEEIGIGNEPWVDDLIAENKRLKAENAQLRAENVKLRARLGIPADADLESEEG
jgi:hypothetical protein